MGTSLFDFLHSSFWGFLECQTTAFFFFFLKRTGGFRDGDGETSGKSLREDSRQQAFTAWQWFPCPRAPPAREAGRAGRGSSKHPLDASDNSGSPSASPKEAPSITSATRK